MLINNLLPAHFSWHIPDISLGIFVSILWLKLRGRIKVGLGVLNPISPQGTPQVVPLVQPGTLWCGFDFIFDE